MRIEILSGSSRQSSITYRLALHLQKVISEQTDHEVGIIDTREYDLPQLQAVIT